MVRLIQTRLLSAVPSVIGVVIVTFLLTRALPGDPAVYFAGPAATPQAIAEIRHSLGLDRSLAEQFLVYIGDLAHGRLGNSLSTGQPVIQELLTRLPASIELTLLALAVSVPSPCRSALLPPGGRTPGSTIFAGWYRPPG